MTKNTIPAINADISAAQDDVAQIQSLKPKENLNLQIWNAEDDNRIFPQVKNKLMQTADYFIKYVSLDDFSIESRIKIVDVVFTGSLANYNWSKYSDIDVHIIMDMSDLTDTEKTLLQAYFKEKKDKFGKTHNIRILGFEIELYIQELNEELVAAGVYSLKNNRWVKIPDKMSNMVDWDLVKRKSLEYMNSIRNLERSITFGSIKNYDDMINAVVDIWRRIKKSRKSGLAEGGELSVENLVFKVLRRNGYMGKLLGLKAKIIDEKLSLGQKTSDSK